MRSVICQTWPRIGLHALLIRQHIAAVKCSIVAGQTIHPSTIALQNLGILSPDASNPVELDVEQSVMAIGTLLDWCVSGEAAPHEGQSGAAANPIS